MLTSQAIEVGRKPHRVAVQTGCIPALLIGKEHYDIGLFFCFGHFYCSIVLFAASCKPFNTCAMSSPSIASTMAF